MTRCRVYVGCECSERIIAANIPSLNGETRFLLCGLERLHSQLETAILSKVATRSVAKASLSSTMFLLLRRMPGCVVVPHLPPALTFTSSADK